jgi:hypothetical protein
VPIHNIKYAIAFDSECIARGAKYCFLASSSQSNTLEERIKKTHALGNPLPRLFINAWASPHITALTQQIANLLLEKIVNKYNKKRRSIVSSIGPLTVNANKDGEVLPPLNQ